MSKKFIIATVALVLAACSGQYAGVPVAEINAYQTGRTYGSLYDLALAYAANLNAAVEADTLHPGMYAEYGVALALMGHKAEANRMLNAEVKSFPQSRSMVRCIKQRLMPELLTDTMTNAIEVANMAKLRGWAYSKADGMKVMHNVASVIDSTDTLRVMQQTPIDSVAQPIRLTANQKRELLVLEQQQAELKRKAAIDSVAAVKQAKADARKQAQAEKAKAKKEKAKAKKQAEKAKKKASRR